MKPAEMARGMEADEYCANRKSKHIRNRSGVKVANAHHQKVAGDGVEEAP